MRRWVVAVGLLVTVAACGSDDETGSDTSSDTTTTLSPWRFADDEPGALRANQPLTGPEQIAQAAAQRELEDWVATCVENLPKLAFLGNDQAARVWDGAGQQEDRLAERCAAIGQDDPEARATLEKAIRQNRADLREVDLSTTTTTTIDPNVASISITCPPRETEAVGSFRAEFDVVQTIPDEVDIREWGIDYGDGRSYKAGSQATAESELYWHNYYETGTFEVTVWITDADDERTEATCSFRWSN